MANTKRIERQQFKEKLNDKYERLHTLPYPRAEFDALKQEIDRDYLKLKELSREATEEWLEEMRGSD